ncbi:hypothetical protein ACP4OV_003201 [Aristida adscensionis]
MSGDGNGRRNTCRGTCCTLLVSVGFSVLIYWAIFQPHQIRATVDSAALSNLTVVSSGAGAVSYRLAVDLGVYNPSKRVKIYYDAIHAELRSRGAAAVLSQAAGTTAFPSEFLQGSKSGDAVKLEFDAKAVAVPGDVAGELEKEARGEAPVSLELAVDVRVRYVFGAVKIRRKPRIRCSLSIPVKAEAAGAGVGGAVSSGDRCHVKY